ncbi:MAG: hypothetical protein SAMD01599839_03950 [Rectinema sp.]
MRHTLRRQPGAGSCKVFLFLLFVSVFLCFFAVSCKGTEVYSFGWFDERGSRLAFSSSVAGSDVSSFSRQGEKRRYTLAKAAEVPEGYSVRLSFSALSGGTEFQVGYGDEKGKNTSVLCSIPEPGQFAFVLPFSGPNALRWVEVKILKMPQQISSGQDGSVQSSQNGSDAQALDSHETLSPPLSLQEIRFVSPMRGMRHENNTLELSPHFSFETKNGSGHYEIRGPFSDLPSGIMDSMQLEVVLEGGSGIAALFWGDQKLTYRHGEEKSAFSLPCSLFADTPDRIALDVKDDIRVISFCVVQSKATTELARIDPGLLVYHAPLDDKPYYLARWDLRPEVLLFLFKDYAIQDRYLKRLAFFVEKIGFVGRLAQDSEIADLHGWNAHDYRPEDLARFFDTAAGQKFPLSAEEIELRELLIKEGVILKNGTRIVPGKGAIVSITQASPAYLQYRFLAHELSHALFFTDGRYKDLVLSLYQKMTDDEKWFLIRYFRWMRYDVDSSYLMANEMQAYLVQQPLKDLEKYFSDTLGDRLAKEHPELADAIHGYMQQHLSALVAIARQLDSYLQASYGFETGRLYRVS